MSADPQAFDERVVKALSLLRALVESGKHFPGEPVLRELASLRRALARSRGARRREPPKLRLVR